MMNKTVSVITRTKNRFIFIQRLFETVVAQSYRPIEWIIVNDHGEAIDTQLEELKLQYAKQLDGIEIFLINKIDSTKGVAAAANTGLAHAHGFYIKLLDDDDTLDATCIEKQVHYMEHEKLPNERGVICYTNNVFETIENDQIHFISSSPSALTSESITSADLAMHNQFSIHSFLYEKEVLGNIGTYNEALFVQEDWEFHLRFIIKYGIGVIPEFLANHHIRQFQQDDYTSNTITNTSLHAHYELMIRTKIMIDQTREWPQNIKEALAVGLETMIEAKENHIHNLLTLNQKLTQELGAKEEHIQNLESLLQADRLSNETINALQHKIFLLENILVTQENTILSLKNEIIQYEMSTSWRITKPLRKIKHILKGH